MAERGAPAVGLSSLTHGATSTFLYGESRPVVNRLLYAMARSVDPDPIWLDLGPGSLGTGEDAGPVELGWIRSDRLFQVWDPEEARPQNGVGNMALLGVVRPDDVSGVLVRLADFVRLAPIAQEVISRVPDDEPRHALVVANSDRVRGDYPHTVDGIAPIVTALVDAPLYPLVGAQGTPGPGRMAFGSVFEVRAKDLRSWEEGALVPDKVPADSRLPAGVPIRLSEIVGLAEAFGTGTGSGQSP